MVYASVYIYHIVAIQPFGCNTTINFISFQLTVQMLHFTKVNASMSFLSAENRKDNYWLLVFELRANAWQWQWRQQQCMCRHMIHISWLNLRVLVLLTFTFIKKLVKYHNGPVTVTAARTMLWHYLSSSSKLLFLTTYKTGPDTHWLLLSWSICSSTVIGDDAALSAGLVWICADHTTLSRNIQITQHWWDHTTLSRNSQITQHFHATSVCHTLSQTYSSGS